MAGGPSVAIQRDIQTLFHTGTASRLSDRQLLGRFSSGRDAAVEAAFDDLVQRRGPTLLRRRTRPRHFSRNSAGNAGRSKAAGPGMMRIHSRETIGFPTDQLENRLLHRASQRHS
jgi:hypothetical protein